MITEPAPDHMCVFICDLQKSKSCMVRSRPIAYGQREANGWHVIEGEDDYTLCRYCWSGLLMQGVFI